MLDKAESLSFRVHVKLLYRIVSYRGYYWTLIETYIYFIKTRKAYCDLE